MNRIVSNKIDSIGHPWLASDHEYSLCLLTERGFSEVNYLFLLGRVEKMKVFAMAVAVSCLARCSTRCTVAHLKY